MTFNTHGPTDLVISPTGVGRGVEDSLLVLNEKTLNMGPPWLIDRIITELLVSTKIRLQSGKVKGQGIYIITGTQNHLNKLLQTLSIRLSHFRKHVINFFLSSIHDNSERPYVGSIKDS